MYSARQIRSSGLQGGNSWTKSSKMAAEAKARERSARDNSTIVVVDVGARDYPNRDQQYPVVSRWVNGKRVDTKDKVEQIYRVGKLDQNGSTVLYKDDTTTLFRYYHDAVENMFKKAKKHAGTTFVVTTGTDDLDVEDALCRAQVKEEPGPEGAQLLRELIKNGLDPEQVPHIDDSTVLPTAKEADMYVTFGTYRYKIHIASTGPA